MSAALTAIPKHLVSAQYASNSQTTIYTVPLSTTTIIDKFTVSNNDGAAAHTLNINIVPSGQSAGATNLVVNAVSVGAGATVDLTVMQNQILAASEQLSVLASSASNLVISVSGRECS